MVPTHHYVPHLILSHSGFWGPNTIGITSEIIDVTSGYNFVTGEWSSWTTQQLHRNINGRSLGRVVVRLRHVVMRIPRCVEVLNLNQLLHIPPVRGAVVTNKKHTSMLNVGFGPVASTFHPRTFEWGVHLWWTGRQPIEVDLGYQTNFQTFGEILFRTRRGAPFRHDDPSWPASFRNAMAKVAEVAVPSRSCATKSEANLVCRGRTEPDERGVESRFPGDPISRQLLPD